MLEATFNRTAQTLTMSNGQVWKFKCLIDTVAINNLDTINQMFETNPGVALIYTNAGIWNRIVDNSGIKDNIEAKAPLFVASYVSDEDNIVYPGAFKAYGLFKFWEHEQIKVYWDDTRVNIADWCSLISVEDGPADDEPAEDDEPEGEGEGEGVEVKPMVTCPECGHKFEVDLDKVD